MAATSYPSFINFPQICNIPSYSLVLCERHSFFVPTFPALGETACKQVLYMQYTRKLCGAHFRRILVQKFWFFFFSSADKIEHKVNKVFDVNGFKPLIFTFFFSPEILKSKRANLWYV